MPYKDPHEARRQSAVRMKEWRSRNPTDRAASVNRALELLEARAEAGELRWDQLKRMVLIVAEAERRQQQTLQKLKDRNRYIDWPNAEVQETSENVKPVKPATPVIPTDNIANSIANENVKPVAPEQNLNAESVKPDAPSIDRMELERQQREKTKATMKTYRAGKAAIYRAAKANLIAQAEARKQEHDEPS